MICEEPPPELPSHSNAEEPALPQDADIQTETQPCDLPEVPTSAEIEAVPTGSPPQPVQEESIPREPIPCEPIPCEPIPCEPQTQTAPCHWCPALTPPISSESSTMYSILPKAEDMQKMFLDIIAKLLEADKRKIFWYPVNVNVVPHYLSVIERPIDLGTIKKQLLQGQYDECWLSVEEDVLLTFQNAKTFNESDTIYHREAMRLEAMAERLFRSHISISVRFALVAQRIYAERTDVDQLSKEQAAVANLGALQRDLLIIAVNCIVWDEQEIFRSPRPPSDIPSQPTDFWQIRDALLHHRAFNEPSAVLNVTQFKVAIERCIKAFLVRRTGDEGYTNEDLENVEDVVAQTYELLTQLCQKWGVERKAVYSLTKAYLNVPGAFRQTHRWDLAPAGPRRQRKAAKRPKDFEFAPIFSSVPKEESKPLARQPRRTPKLEEREKSDSDDNDIVEEGGAPTAPAEGESEAAVGASEGDKGEEAKVKEEEVEEEEEGEENELLKTRKAIIQRNKKFLNKLDVDKEKKSIKANPRAKAPAKKTTKKRKKDDDDDFDPAVSESSSEPISDEEPASPNKPPKGSAPPAAGQMNDLQRMQYMAYMQQLQLLQQQQMQQQMLQHAAETGNVQFIGQCLQQMQQHLAQAMTQAGEKAIAERQRLQQGLVVLQRYFLHARAISERRVQQPVQGLGAASTQPGMEGSMMGVEGVDGVPGGPQTSEGSEGTSPSPPPNGMMEMAPPQQPLPPPQQPSVGAGGGGPGGMMEAAQCAMMSQDQQQQMLLMQQLAAQRQASMAHQAEGPVMDEMPRQENGTIPHPNTDGMAASGMANGAGALAMHSALQQRMALLQQYAAQLNAQPLPMEHKQALLQKVAAQLGLTNMADGGGGGGAPAAAVAPMGFPQVADQSAHHGPLAVGIPSHPQS